jgi:hypothetical protein
LENYRAFLQKVISMAKRRKRRRVSFGDPPLVHTKRLRKLIPQYGRLAKEAARRAAEGTSAACSLAQTLFEDAHRLRGQVQAHMDSLGSKRKFAIQRINLTDHARAMVAARKALENHCGRQRAY